MKIANGIEMLELTMNLMGAPMPVYPTLIWDNDMVILVDAGFPAPNIRAAMDQAGVSFDKLRMVIITHQDMDHIGGLPGILQASDHKVAVLAHADDKPYIQGEKRSIKMTPERIAQMDSLPEERRKIMKAMYENPPKANVDQTLTDGEELPYCGGIVAIHTPGHTPGHICLYQKKSKTLIAGDALNVSNGQLIGPVPHFTYDIDLAIKSLRKLTQMDIENVICYHGGLYKGNANQRIAELSEG